MWRNILKRVHQTSPHLNLARLCTENRERVSSFLDADRRDEGGALLERDPLDWVQNSGRCDFELATFA